MPTTTRLPVLISSLARGPASSMRVRTVMRRSSGSASPRPVAASAGIIDTSRSASMRLLVPTYQLLLRV